MRAQWSSLPQELQEHVLWLLSHMRLYLGLDYEHFCGTRLVNKSFAAQLRSMLWIFCPGMHPGFVEHFVEGLMRYTAENVSLLYKDKICYFTTPVYSQLYSRVYAVCTYKPPHNKSEGLYCALYHKVVKLVKDGTLADITGEKRNLFIRFLAQVFKYLDRFYVKRLSLPDVRANLVDAFRAAEV